MPTKKAGFKYAVRDDIGQGMHIGWIDAYVYAADLFCEDCGRAIQKGMKKTSDNEDDYPQGPYPDGGGEADGPEHCGNHDRCLNAMEFAGTKVGVWLGNPLTTDGVEALKEMLSNPNANTYQLALHDFWGRVYSDYLEGWEPPPEEWEPSPMQLPLPGVREPGETPRYLSAGRWYYHKSSVSYGSLGNYFYPVSVQKNGKLAGVLVETDPHRPRSKPKAVKGSWDSENNGWWTEIAEGEVPTAVRQAAHPKLQERSASSHGSVTLRAFAVYEKGTKSRVFFDGPHGPMTEGWFPTRADAERAMGDHPGWEVRETTVLSMGVDRWQQRGFKPIERSVRSHGLRDYEGMSYEDWLAAAREGHGGHIRDDSRAQLAFSRGVDPIEFAEVVTGGFALEERVTKRFRVGSRVQMVEDAIQNYGEKWNGLILRVTHVATSHADHPGFDPGGGSALYDLEVAATRAPLPMSLYDWELEPTGRRS
jgi:hypothetical protein